MAISFFGAGGGTGLFFAGFLALALVGTLVWVLLLRRQVAATTHRLAAEMRSRRDAAVDAQPWRCTAGNVQIAGVVVDHRLE